MQHANSDSSSKYCILQFPAGVPLARIGLRGMGMMIPRFAKILSTLLRRKQETDRPFRRVKVFNPMP